VGTETYATPEALQNDFQTWYTHTSSNQQTQTTSGNADFPENSLDALVAAATDFHWRDENSTVRMVIHATDDTFLEKPESFSSGIPAEHTYSETVAALQNASIRVASFAAQIGGSRGDEDVSVGFLSNYEGAHSIPEATSGKAFDLELVGTDTSLVQAITDFIINESCEEYIPVV
jgi:hypothetical protein